MILQSKLFLATARIFVKRGLDREERCDVTKIQTCELMGLVSILRKNKLKKNALAKNQAVIANW